VQISFAGYPASTGLETIQYRISDRYLEERRARRMEVEHGSSGEWSGAELRSPNSELPLGERVFLIDSFWCYDPCGMEVAINELPAKQSGWITFGSLNHFCKINSQVLPLWARVLAQVPDSRLVLLSPPGDHRQKLLEFLGREGVAAERIEFVASRPRREYLELYHRLDIVLDPFPYNGHTTSLDALWMGVPLVSLKGNTAVGRGGWSVLSNIGLPELAADSASDYVRIATGLAGDLPRLISLRATLRKRMEASVLMDGPRFARNVEGAYRRIWRSWCAGRA
jgi:predicted O-linked N-acetylglucosamine transferase (SPINDLY family)